MQCDGKALKVTKNCKQALQNLRTTQPRTLWVDAVCIDQSLHEERNQQVMMMQKIYKKATRVIIWLGPSSKHLDNAMSAVKLLADVLRTETGLFMARPYLLLLAQLCRMRNQQLDLKQSCRFRTDHLERPPSTKSSPRPYSRKYWYSL